MTESVPNVPLERCEKIARAARRTAAAAAERSTLTSGNVQDILEKIAVHLDELAIMIQQDQSGEI